MTEDKDSYSSHRATDSSLPKLFAPTSCLGQQPGVQVHIQTDFILTPQCFKSSINKANTRSFPGAGIGSDHDLVLTAIKLKLKTKCFKKSPHIRFEQEKLKDMKIMEVFQARVGGKFAAHCIFESNVDTLANSLE